MATTYGAAPKADLTEETFESGGRYEFLRFHHPNSSNAAYVIADCGPGTPLGCPIISTRVPEIDSDGNPVLIEGGDKDGLPNLIPSITDVRKSPFFVLTVFQAWLAKPTTVPYDPTGAWLSRQAFDAVHEGNKVKEAFVAQVLVLTDEGPRLTLCEVIGPKAKWLKQFISATIEADTKDFMKANAALVKDTKGCPGFRNVGNFVIKNKTGDFGPWCYVEGDYDTPTQEELDILMDFINDPETEAQRESMAGLYDEKVEKIRDLAASTPPLD